MKTGKIVLGVKGRSNVDFLEVRQTVFTTLVSNTMLPIYKSAKLCFFSIVTYNVILLKGKLHNAFMNLMFNV
jgi:hypothetical protein